MATSEAGICNLALMKLGVTETIDDLEEDTPAARACALLYEQCRDSLLVLLPWPFAQRRATLTVIGEVEDDLELEPTWEYAYALPDDCLLARHLFAGTRNPRPDERVKFAIEGHETHKKILLTDFEGTDDDPAELTYTARIEDVTIFPPHFVDALAWSLAAELAAPLSIDERREDRARRGFELALQRAGAVALNEGDPDGEPTDAITAARG